MPLQRRVPKFGFTNINRKDYQGINLDTLQTFVDAGKISEVVDLKYLENRRVKESYSFNSWFVISVPFWCSSSIARC